MSAVGTTIRVLVVEDETMIAMALEDSIEMLGYQIIGPVAQLEEALILATKGGFDCAILDVNIRGGNSFAVADILLNSGCPFLLTTGYSDWSLPKHLAGQTRLTKPYSTSELETQLRVLCSQVEEGRQNGSSSES